MNRILFSLLVLGISSAAVHAEPGLSPNAIPVCYDYGCASKQIVSLGEDEWGEISGWFTTPAEDAQAERDRIRNAVGWMEVIIGRHTPTHRDVGRNPFEAEGPGQMDCIDESLNSTTYLKLFEAMGLLRWHRVLDRAYRTAVFDQHWAGQIEELATGEHYVVDTWFHKNGILPYIQKTEQWSDIPFFFSSFTDNSTN